MRLEIPEKKHEKDYVEMIQEFLDNKEKIIPRSLIPQGWEDYDAFMKRMKK